MRTLNDFNYETTRPVEVAVWTNEEGSRFAPAMVASGVFAGVFPLEYGLSRADLDGKTMGEELKRIGYDGDRSRSAAARCARSSRPTSSRARSWRPRRRPSAWSQGAQGQRWFEVTMIGQEAHAGPTPMKVRKDALVGAAHVVLAVNRIGTTTSRSPARPSA